MVSKRKKKYESGEGNRFMSRRAALKMLQLSLKDFRKLCILKGIYPREPRNRKRAQQGASGIKTLYHTKDIQFLMHEPIIWKLRDYKIFARKMGKARAVRDFEAMKRYLDNHPHITLDNIVKERYPSFIDAIRDLDDCLTLLFLFSTFPSLRHVPRDQSALCRRLTVEFLHAIIASRALRKVFVSIKGYYFQAEIKGQTVTWIVPHHFSFVPQSTQEVDFRIMSTFVEFYAIMLGFVNFRLYHSLNLHYPPKFAVISDFSCAAQQLNASQSTHRFSFVNHTIKTVNMPKYHLHKSSWCNNTFSKHQANKQLNSKQRQLFLTQPTTSNVRSEFNIDLCRSLISADIPLYKLKNKVFREFLEKYTQHTIPDESTLRKTYAPSIYDETIQKIRDEIKDSSIWVSIDETPDKEGRLVGNVVIGLLSEQYSERILLHCDVLEKCNNKTIVKLFNEAMGILWPKGMVRGLVTLDTILDKFPGKRSPGEPNQVITEANELGLCDRSTCLETLRLARLEHHIDSDETEKQLVDEEVFVSERVAALNVPLVRTGADLTEEDDEVEMDQFPMVRLICSFVVAKSVQFSECFGGEVSWDKLLFVGATFNESDETITHQIVDRPSMEKQYISRYYVQPQWIFDSVNARELLPVEKYFLGAILPPHLSPFVDKTREQYIPPEEKSLDDPSLAQTKSGEGDSDDDDDDDEEEEEEEEEGEKESEPNEEKTNKAEVVQQGVSVREQKRKQMAVTTGVVAQEDPVEKKRQERQEYKLREKMIKKKHRNLYKSMMKGRAERGKEAWLLEKKRKRIDEEQKALRKAEKKGKKVKTSGDI
ncbi:hypothetical protein ANN_21316 [Periplaneta americana]|uniref:Pescadillo homolog n=1 Tax=Periplaneta americana TaxID=6978 RepID=A0ABQ8SFC1_PERAM|nr:hypothetical protein ANN_21316 [Periplaneta americana]